MPGPAILVGDPSEIRTPSQEDVSVDCQLPTTVTRTKIVVGVDGSDSSKSALAWAVRQAQLTGAPLQVVTTWEYPMSYGYMMVLPDSMDPAADAKSILDSTMVDIGVELNSDISVTKTVVEGHPALALMRLAEDAALVVVGRRGHGEFTGMLLGSVSEHLATHAPCPVLIVR